MKKINPWLIVSILLFLLLFVSLLTGGFGIRNDSISHLSPPEIAEKAINYINKNILREGSRATIINSSRNKDGVYKINVQIRNQEYTSYVSPDGKMLFPEGFELDKPLAKNKGQGNEPEEIPKAESPDVKLFVMAYCPFGNQAENAMIPVAKLLKDKVKIELGSVIYSDYAKRMGGEAKDWCLDEEQKYCSMHGINELNEDIRELCVAKYQPEKLWDFLEKMNKNTTTKNVEEKWEGIAREVGVNVDKIKKCQKEEAEDLLAEQVAFNKKYNITGSPTLLINGVRYRGARTPEAYKTAICKAFINPPEECQTKLEEGANSSSGGCG